MKYENKLKSTFALWFECPTWNSNLELTLCKTRRERIYGQNCISIFSSMCKHFSEIFAIMSSIKFVLHHNAFCELFSLQSQHFFLKVYFRNLKKVSHTKWIEQWDLNKLCGFVKCHIYIYTYFRKIQSESAAYKLFYSPDPATNSENMNPNFHIILTK